MADILSMIFISLLIFYFIFIRSIRVGIDNLHYYTTSSHVDDIISIIIPFRNESENILENLKSIEAQNYSEGKYEVIYIDDFSDDDSFGKLKTNITKENISLYSMSENKFNKAHKKQAIEFGISKAKGGIIMFTDADCVVPQNWIATMVAGFEGNTALISGPVAFTESSNLFSRLQQLEFAGLILSGAGLIGNKSPMIASSANLAFKKDVFEEVGGYKGLMNLSSGDDELLMQKIDAETDYDIKFCFDKDAVVITNPNKSVEEFAQQRKRWASKGLFYRNKMIVLQLILVFLFYLGLVVLPVLGFVVDSRFFTIFFASVFVKMLVEYSVLRYGEEMLFEKFSFPLFLLAELLQVPYILYSAISGAFGNFTWKERKLER